MVERVVEGLPEADLVASLDLVEEAVDSSDGLALVVASQDDNLPWESDLQSVKKADDLTRLLATVYVIAHEEVASLHRDDFVALELVLVLLADVVWRWPAEPFVVPTRLRGGACAGHRHHASATTNQKSTGQGLLSFSSGGDLEGGFRGHSCYFKIFFKPNFESLNS